MKTTKRIVSFVLCLAMALTMALSLTGTASAAPADSPAIAALRAAHPEDSYFSEYYIDGVYKAKQCMGYAYQLMYEAYGTHLYDTCYENHDMEDSLKNLKAGDVVRYIPRFIAHSIFVTAVEGDTVWYTDSNGRSDGKGPCIVDWDKKTTKSDLRRGFRYVTPGLWDLNAEAASAPAPEPSTSDFTATYNQFLPAKAMMLTNSKKDCYDNYGGAKVGRIYGSDVVTIQEIKQYNGELWCKLLCPWSEGGRSYNKTVYAPLRYFMDTSFSPWVQTVAGQYTTYWRSDASSRAGYTGAGDTCMVVGQTNGYCHILYPLAGGGYKLAFM